MRIFDKLTGGGVEWQIELASPTGVYRPGEEIVGRVRYMAKGNLQARAILVALTAAEHYVHMVRERRSSVGSSSRRSGSEWEREWFSDELYRQQLDIAGTTTLAAQQQGEFEFRFTLPPDAVASFDSDVLRLRWQVRAWMDAGGRDPSTERDVYVVLGADRLTAPEAALAANSADQTGTLWIEPAPIVAGQQFRGALETAEQIDPRNVRVELKQHIETHGAGGQGMSIGLGDMNLSLGGQRGVADDRVLWSGQLAPAGAGPAGQRYEFAGHLPPGPVGTVNLPHGSSTASIDVVISRRLMPDRHVTRPIAIVTG